MEINYSSHVAGLNLHPSSFDIYLSYNCGRQTNAVNNQCFVCLARAERRGRKYEIIKHLDFLFNVKNKESQVRKLNISNFTTLKHIFWGLNQTYEMLPSNPSHHYSVCWWDCSVEPAAVTPLERPHRQLFLSGGNPFYPNSEN